VVFRSAAPFTVCAHCQSLLVRRDITLESLGRVAQVPEDVSPLQLQTSGRYEQRRFTLIGRLRKAWEEGSWSEWCALFDDQQLGWLAEAQGDLMMLFERPLNTLAVAPTPDVLQQLGPGGVLTIAGNRFTVTDKKRVTCIGAEGELGAGRPPGPSAKMVSIDLKGPGLELATLEAVGGHVSLFVGHYVDFEQCDFTGLRTLEGWAAPRGGSRVGSR
jgi:hypothetical protein